MSCKSLPASYASKLTEHNKGFISMGVALGMKRGTKEANPWQLRTD